MLKLSIETTIYYNKMDFRLLILSAIFLTTSVVVCNDQGPKANIFTNALDFGRGYIAGFVN